MILMPPVNHTRRRQRDEQSVEQNDLQIVRRISHTIRKMAPRETKSQGVLTLFVFDTGHELQHVGTKQKIVDVSSFLNIRERERERARKIVDIATKIRLSVLPSCQQFEMRRSAENSHIPTRYKDL